MTKIALALFLSALLDLCLQVASAQAQLARTAVSTANGNDANDCSAAAPCRTLGAAHTATLDQGEIIVLDPGGYGALTITKSISIYGRGEASILVSGGGVGITINAPPGGYVNLRGFTIQGIGFGGGTGIRFNSGASLTIQNCVVRNHSPGVNAAGSGIEFFPNASSSLSVSNTSVTENGGAGIIVYPNGSGTVKVVLNRVEAYNNGSDGVTVNGNLSTGAINASVTDSKAANNVGAGFAVASSPGHPVTNLTVVRSLAANNGTGLIANGANATLRLLQSTVTGNTTSWSASSGGVLRSYGDNTIDGNGDGGPALTIIPKK